MVFIPIIILGLIFTAWVAVDHWAMRVFASFPIGAILGLLLAMAFGMDKPPEQNFGWVGLLIGFAAAWFVAGIPHYIRQARARDASLSLSLRD